MHLEGNVLTHKNIKVSIADVHDETRETRRCVAEIQKSEFEYECEKCEGGFIRRSKSASFFILRLYTITYVFIVVTRLRLSQPASTQVVVMYRKRSAARRGEEKRKGTHT